MQPPAPAPEYITHQPVALQEQVEDHSLDTYQEDSQAYDDYGQYVDEQHYPAAADTSHTLQNFETGKGETHLLIILALVTISHVTLVTNEFS